MADKIQPSLDAFLNYNSEIKEPLTQVQPRTATEITTFPDEPTPVVDTADVDTFLNSMAQSRNRTPYINGQTAALSDKKVADNITRKQSYDKARKDYYLKEWGYDNQSFLAGLEIEPDVYGYIGTERVETIGLRSGAWLKEGINKVTDRLSKGVATMYGGEEGMQGFAEITKGLTSSLLWIASAGNTEFTGFDSYNEYMEYVSGAVGIDDIDYKKIVDIPGYIMGPEFYQRAFKGVVLNSDDIKTTYDQYDTYWNALMSDEEGMGKKIAKAAYSFGAETLATAPSAFLKGTKVGNASKAKQILGNEPLSHGEMSIVKKYFDGDDIFKLEPWQIRSEIQPLAQIDGMTQAIDYGKRSMGRYEMMVRNTRRAAGVKAAYQDNPAFHSGMNKIIAKLEGSSINYEAWEAYKKSELHKKFSKSEYLRKTIKGEAGAIAAKGALKGKLDRSILNVDFSDITQQEWDALFDGLLGAEETRAVTASQVLLDLKAGELPPAGALQTFMDEVGEAGLEIAEAIIAAAPEKYADSVNYINETLTFMRAVRSSYDMSSVLNQGGFAARTHTGDFLDTYKTVTSLFLKDAKSATVHVKNWAKYSPNASRYKQMGIDITQTGKRLVQTGMEEEQFISEFARHIPGMKISEDFHSSFLNMLRMNLADSQIALLDAAGAPPEVYQATGKFINVMTGRGTLPDNAFADLMKVALWAPKYTASKFEMYKFLGSSTPEVRKLAIGDMLQYHYANNRMMALADTFGRATGKFKVGTDPLNSDYGKVITPDGVRRDMLGAYAQPQRLLGAILTGYRTSRLTGDEFPVGRMSEMARFFEGKLDPVLSAIMEVSTGVDFTGKQLTEKSKLDIVKDNFLPIFAGEVLDIARYSESNMAMPFDLFLASQGASVSAYEPDYRALQHMRKEEVSMERFDKPLKDLNFAEAKALMEFMEIGDDKYRTYQRKASTIGKVTDTSLQVRRNVQDNKDIMKSLPSSQRNALKAVNADKFIGNLLPRRISETHNMTPEQMQEFKQRVADRYNQLLGQFMRNPVYKNLDDNAKFDWMQEYYANAVEIAMLDMKAAQVKKK